eukprot:8965265-Lingulodinium_polyedra.AAC.1
MGAGRRGPERIVRRLAFGQKFWPRAHGKTVAAATAAARERRALVLGGAPIGRCGGARGRGTRACLPR